MKRVLITGASGLLGRALMAEFSSHSTWEVKGLAFTRSLTGYELEKCDLRDETAVRSVMDKFKPNVVIHSAAERRPDIVEKQQDLTRQLNVDASASIARICADIGAFLVYISTDYVFDGTSPPYKPGDQTNPLNKYGQSKLDGEKVVLDNHTEAAVLRVPILYGQVERVDESAVTVLLTSVLDTSHPAKMSNCETRYPTHVVDVALVCQQMAEQQLAGKAALRGIHHWSGNEAMTKYDMAKTMAKVFDLPSDHIEAVNQPSLGTPRPKNSHLDASDLINLGIGRQTEFAKGIQQCLQKFVQT